MPGSAVSDLAGRVLAGRYLLHGAIGTGASGRVYVADDTRLRRRVAVKVLHAALAEDAAFLRRFRAEAQLAASLHHPHIVTVHDWGEDDVPFMVLELLEGGSLRGMLDQGTRLSVSQAARIGRDVASALEYAHARGVLHRDIKPANLLFDEHGRVRVADFGLARALAEASWTEPAGAVFGTARYASPEQAHGVQLDGRSDLYSLALVLVEAVTGSLPFTADTTLGLLTARTRQPLTAPDSMGPLAHVIDRAGAIDPNDRYPDAVTMRGALSDTADALPPPAPLPVAGMVDRADPNPTRAVPVPASTSTPTPAPASAHSTNFFDQDAIEVIPEPESAPAIFVDDRKKPRSNVQGQRRLVPYVVAFVLLVTVAIASFALARVGGAATLSVPQLAAMNEKQAVDAAKAAGFNVEFTAARSSIDRANTVIDQNPKPGKFTSSRTIRVTLSSGPPLIAVPTSIIGKQWSQAQRILNDANLVPQKDPPSEYNDLAAAGIVLRIVGGNAQSLPEDSVVQVVLSKGHWPVAVPDVSKESFAAASNALKALGFTVQRAPDDEFSPTVKSGDVTRTEPPAKEQAAYGSQIIVHVSKGPDLVVVPNLTNLNLTDATDALTNRGLQIAINGSTNGNRRVVEQDQTPGSKIPRGSTVTVRFGKPPFDPTCIITLSC